MYWWPMRLAGHGQAGAPAACVLRAEDPALLAEIAAAYACAAWLNQVVNRADE
jgi:hypothetical protein